MTLVKNNELLNLNIEDNSIIVTNYYNKKNYNSGILLIENIWKLFNDLNIYICCHIYRKQIEQKIVQLKKHL